MSMGFLNGEISLWPRGCGFEVGTLYRFDVWMELCVIIVIYITLKLHLVDVWLIRPSVIIYAYFKNSQSLTKFYEIRVSLEMTDNKGTLYLICLHFQDITFLTSSGIYLTVTVCFHGKQVTFKWKYFIYKHCCCCNGNDATGIGQAYFV